MKERRPGTPSRPKAARPAPATREEAERRWLLSTFASLAGDPPDVESLVRFRARSRTTSWAAGLLSPHVERRRSPGRRLADLARPRDPG